MATNTIIFLAFVCSALVLENVDAALSASRRFPTGKNGVSSDKCVLKGKKTIACEKSYNALLISTGLKHYEVYMSCDRNSRYMNEENDYCLKYCMCQQEDKALCVLLDDRDCDPGQLLPPRGAWKNFTINWQDYQEFERLLNAVRAEKTRLPED